MPKLTRLAIALLLVTCALSANSAEVTLRQFTGQVQPALNPQLSAWVAAQTGVAARTAGPVDLAALRGSAAAALGTRRATPESIEVLVALVMLEMWRQADADTRQILDEIERNVALKKQLHDAMALLREGENTDLTDLLDANPTLISVRQKRIDEIRKALDEARPVQGVNQDLALALQLAIARASQAMQQLTAALAAFSRSGAAIIGNLRG